MRGDCGARFHTIQGGPCTWRSMTSRSMRAGGWCLQLRRDSGLEQNGWESERVWTVKNRNSNKLLSPKSESEGICARARKRKDRMCFFVLCKQH